MFSHTALVFLSRIRDHTILRSQDIMIWVGSGMQLAKTPIYPALYQFIIFCTFMWSQSTNITDGQRNAQMSCSIAHSKVCLARNWRILFLLLMCPCIQTRKKTLQFFSVVLPTLSPHLYTISIVCPTKALKGNLQNTKHKNPVLLWTAMASWQCCKSSYHLSNNWHFFFCNVAHVNIIHCLYTVLNFTVF